MVTDARSSAVSIGPLELPGDLVVPAAARGLVVFAHGSGSSRLSPRNRLVATRLNDAGFATLLFDLLTSHEESIDQRTAELRFDIGLLGRRLVEAIDWIGGWSDVRDLPLGCFGASTGAGAAIVAAGARPETVRAIVSRGGRPDLAGDVLDVVHVPTLLIVGGADEVVVGLNQGSAARIGESARIVIVPGATHLFEEPGALMQVADLARDWFTAHL